jgi:hypothetical protein
MKTLTTTVLALFILSGSALATLEPDFLINSGAMAFDYAQVPSGPVSGHFSSDGMLAHDPPNEGTAATAYVLDGVHYLTIIGAMEDGTNYTDGAVIIVSGAEPITAGTYDLDGTTGFLAFVDDAVGWIPPSDLWKTNWAEELLLIDAAGKYGSTSGTVTFSQISWKDVQGGFEAMVTDPETGVELAITSGSFVIGVPVATERSSWSSVKALYR